MTKKIWLLIQLSILAVFCLPNAYASSLTGSPTTSAGSIGTTPQPTLTPQQRLIQEQKSKMPPRVVDAMMKKYCATICCNTSSQRMTISSPDSIQSDTRASYCWDQAISNSPNSARNTAIRECTSKRGLEAPGKCASSIRCNDAGAPEDDIAECRALPQNQVRVY